MGFVFGAAERHGERRETPRRQHAPVTAAGQQPWARAPIASLRHGRFARRGRMRYIRGMFSHRPVVPPFVLRIALAFGTGLLIVALL